MGSKQSATRVTKFEDFWQLYLHHHRHPVNQFLHAFGTIGALICLILSALLSWKLALIAVPFGYGFAWLGHFLIEGNSPLTFQYPFWSLIADYRLVGFMICGRKAEGIPTAAQK